MEVCDAMSVELRLDRIDAELARELPHHLRELARTYARGLRLPWAPDVLCRATTLATARDALAHPVLADRGLALLRLVAPIAIEGDAAVAAAYVAPKTWPALAALAAARDAASRARFGRRAIDVMQLLHGAAGRSPAASIGQSRLAPPVRGWSVPDGVAVDEHAIARVWYAMRTRHGVDGAVRFERSAGARPRTFVVEPGREVVVVVPAQLATPADRFAILHELGHVVAALALPAGIPRVVDEAAAAYVARSIEVEGPWFAAAAVDARSRRAMLARVLDRIEGALPEIAEHMIIRPPWALWHDPGAQAAYIAAEAMADAIMAAIGPTPPPGALAAALTAQRDAIDRRGAPGV
jgi:hypothetical protein